MTAVKVVFYLAVVIACWTIIDGSAINNIAPSEVNADYLIELGIKTNDVKLQAVGMAMNNIHSDPCSEWAKWSVCSANYFLHFGIKQRSRKCSNETEFSLCRNRCPLSYQTTRLGYCIKKHRNHVSHFHAEKECKKEGGYLVRIDSQLKYLDIINTGLSMYTSNSRISIGGHRNSTHSPWLFGDGSKLTFFKWATSEPDNGNGELCIYMNNKGYMHDVACLVTAYFICENPA
jgi:hypothetical protein